MDTGGPNDGSSGVLTKGFLRPGQVFAYGVALFGAGTVLGPKVYKYLALGDVFVFVLMGPLSVVGTHIALTSETTFGVLLASIPVGLLVAEIMALNHRDAATDHGAGVRTLSSVVGFRASRLENVVLPIVAYAFVTATVVGGYLSPWTLLVFLSAPLALKILQTVWASDGRAQVSRRPVRADPPRPRCPPLRRYSARGAGLLTPGFLSYL